ncbi:MAG: IclR family transcriptional regulator [Solirubrobacteraceae bacterium]
MAKRAQATGATAGAPVSEAGLGTAGVADAVKPGRAGGERETSIRRGIEVLLSLSSDESLDMGGLGVTRISELLGREKSQVSRALKALNEYGLVERTKDNGYRLGWRLYALAQLAGEPRLLETAAPVIRRLAHSLGERVHLSVRQGTDTLTILSESSGRSLQTTGWAGRMTPAYCTSAGRALLSDWDPEEILAAFEPVQFIALGPRTVGSPAALVRSIAADLERGYTVVDEEFEPDLIGVAVPVRDPAGAIVAAINVSAPRFRFIDRVPEAAAALAVAATELTRELGDRDSSATG